MGLPIEDPMTLHEPMKNTTLLALAERRSGYVIMLLGGLFAAAMPVLHMRGTGYAAIATSAGGFFFVWTLWALGGLGGLTFILSARGLWSLRRGQSR